MTHPQSVEQDEEPDRPAQETPAERAVDPYRAPFDAMVRALAAQDPRFIRRVMSAKVYARRRRGGGAHLRRVGFVLAEVAALRQIAAIGGGPAGSVVVTAAVGNRASEPRGDIAVLV